jgi:hypothetical protein
MTTEVNAVTKYAKENPRSLALAVGLGVVASWLSSGLIIPLIAAIVGFIIGKGMDKNVGTWG